MSGEKKKLAGLAGLLLLGAAPAPADVLSFEVTLTPDFAAGTVSGVETIRFAGAAIGFTEPALALSNVRLDGRAVEFRREGGRLLLQAGPGRHALTLAFAGKPKRGLIFSKDFVYSSYFACDWMVCDQDAPGDKATIALKLNLPKGMTSVVSAPKSPEAPYLFGFAAGRMKRVELGKRLAAYAPADTGDDVFSLLSPTADMAALFAAKAGSPLPHGRYDQVLVPSSEAQEASSFSLLGLGTVAAMRADPTEDWAMAHELSHQWWGNALTCADWSEFWLNEGFATFMTAAWKEHRWGRAAYDREVAIARKRWDASTAAGFDKPLAWAGEYPSLRVRRGIVYSKGAVFLDTLRTAVGDAAFWKGVRLYTRAHLGRTVRSRDLQRAMEKASGKRLDQLFNTWVYPQ